MSDNAGGIDQAGQDLFDYAVDREELKWLMSNLPAEADADRNSMEYELQILKIIAVGWSLSFYLENHPFKLELAKLYWDRIRQFSNQLSETTRLMTGKDIDYFQVLKNRLDDYVAVMAQNPEAKIPSAAIGPSFARHCGSPDDVYAIMTGTKMFHSVLVRVRKYLSALKWLEDEAR